MEPFYIGHLIPFISSYEKVVDKYGRGLIKKEFYEEPIGVDLIYPDW